MNSVKETLEALDVLRVLAECYVEAQKDGVVNWMDIPKFRPALGVLAKAIDGADRIESELRDIDMAELLTIANKLREIAVLLQRRK